MKTEFGHIYNYSYNNEILYIGSTFDLQDRERLHKSVLNNEKSNQYNKPFYVYLRDQKLQIKDLKKEIINTTLKTKQELENFEGILIRQLRPKCNKVINGRTMKEYNEDNKEIIKENKKEYRLNNKEKIKEYKKEYYEDNKEKINETRKNNRVSCIKCKKEVRVDSLDKHYKNIHS